MRNRKKSKIRKFARRFISPLSMVNSGAGVAVASIFVAGILTAEPELSEISEPEQPADSENNTLPTEVPSEDQGFFPTLRETELLGGDYSRSRFGRLNEPADIQAQTATGIYPYPNPGELSRAPWADDLAPLNPYLGFFTPHQRIIGHNGNDWPEGLSFDLDSSFPLLVRDFVPERAMFKAGPTYFDPLFVGMTVLHSDYQGRANFPNGDDGWLIGIEFGAMGLIQFTDQFYLSLSGVLVYLPLDNKLGVRLGSGGNPTVLADLNFLVESGTWDWRLYNQFYASAGGDVFLGLESGARQSAGRYTFGFNDRHRNGSGFYNGDNSYFVNAIGFEGSTPSFWADWRFWLSGVHRDTWRSWDFDDHLGTNELQARMEYNGSRLWFSPYFQYYLNHNQETDAVDNRIYAGLRGRITENLSANGRVGYLWRDKSSGAYDDQFLASVELNHEISRYTSHSIGFGQEYFSDDITGDTVVSEYARYSIDHQFTRSLVGRAYVQQSDDDGPRFRGSRTNVTGILRYEINSGNDSGIMLRGAYEKLNGHLGRPSGDRWLGRLSYTREVFSRVRGELFYQYEESTVATSFNEQLFGLSLRKYF